MKAKNNGSQIHFWCPGCDHAHGIDPKLWTWNSSEEIPTFSPSVLVFPHKTLSSLGTVVNTPRCHSFVTDGKIQFLSDSEHGLSGKIVDLPDWPYDR